MTILIMLLDKQGEACHVDRHMDAASLSPLDLYYMWEINLEIVLRPGALYL